MAGVAWGQLLPIVLVGLVLVWRMRRLSRPSPLTPWRLWLVPGLIAAMAGLVVWAHPPDLSGWLALGGAAALGGVLGWWRGRFTVLARDPASGQLTMRQSPAGMLLLLAVIAVRFGLRQSLGATMVAGQPNTAFWLVTDGMLGFAVGFLGFYRLEIGLRARRH